MYCLGQDATEDTDSSQILRSAPHLLIFPIPCSSQGHNLHLSKFMCLFVQSVYCLSYPEDWKLCEGEDGWDHCNIIHAQRPGLAPEVNQ